MRSRRRTKPRYLLVTVLSIVVALILVKILLDYRAFRRKEREETLKEQRMAVRVEVLNGTHVKDLAASVSDQLRDLGFDVVFVGNASDTVGKTVIVERADSTMRNAAILSEEIGCDCIARELDPDRLLEVSLVLGGDYAEIFEVPEDEPRE